MSASGAPASTSAADTTRVRGVAFGWAKVAVSITMPAIRPAARAPSSASSGTPSRAARSVTISHVAAASGSIQSAAPSASFEAWWSMMTRGSRSNSSAWRTPTSPIRSSEPQSEMTTRSYGAAGSGSVRKRSMPAMNAYRSGTGSVHTGSAVPPRASTSADDPERRPERVRVRVLVADRQHAPGAAQPVDDGLRDGVEVAVERDGHARTLARAGRLARRGRAGGRASSPGPRRDRRPDRRRRLFGQVVRLAEAWHRRRQRFGDRGVRIRHAPGLELGQQLEDPRTALGRVVQVDVQVRDAPDPEPPAQLVADERHRVAQRRDRRVALGRLADDADPDLGVAQVLRGLDDGDRGEADPRIRDLPRQDRADLLPQQFVDALCSLAHATGYRRAARMGRSGEGARRARGASAPQGA